MAKTEKTETTTPPKISVMERRLQRGVFHQGSHGIPLKHPEKWVTRIVDSKITTDRPWVMQEKGWVYLEPDDLAVSPDQIGWKVSADGKIVRGEHGRDIVMKMAKADWDLLNQHKTRENLKQTFGTKQVKNAMVNAAAAAHGEEAAEYVSKHAQTMDIKDSRERVPLGE